MNKIKVSFGNRKLPKDTMIFNLPARITCPGRTALCSGACYALKAERMYKAVLPARKSNFTASRHPAFAEHMTDVIQAHAHKIKRVRVHESGDFYNRDYLNKWFLIASTFPAITFYAYTKSFHLDFSACPDNFKLIASLDVTTKGTALLAYERQKRVFKNTFTIVDRHAPITSATCPGDCRACSRCWTGTGRRIVVNQH